MLTWIPENLRKILADHGISNRKQLSDAFPSIARSVVYRSFSESWEGHATVNILAAIADRFSAPLDSLVTAKEF